MLGYILTTYIYFTKKELVMCHPQAVLSIKGSMISFRFQHVPMACFSDYLAPFKGSFPTMKWNPQLAEWQLPINEIKPLYELCRAIFYPDNVQIFTPNSTSSDSPAQLLIFS